MLEDLSFCDRERALLSVIIKTVLTFAVVKKRKRNLSDISVFSEYAKKERRSNLNLVLVIVLVLESKGL